MLKLQRPRVYVETTIVSYLTALPSKDVLILAKQKLTKTWWQHAARHFECFVSEAVLEEAKIGDEFAAKRRLNAIKNLALLQTTKEAIDFADLLLKKGPIPKKAAVDALHIATAAVFKMDYLVSWNCKHIANAALRRKISELAEKSGLVCPIICTPQELME